MDEQSDLDGVMEEVEAKGIPLTCLLEYASGDNNDDPEADPMVYVVREGAEEVGRFGDAADAAAYIREEYM